MPTPRNRRARLGFDLLEDRSTPNAVPILHSLPGSPAKLFMDFDGDSNGGRHGFPPVTTPAYDTDGNPSAFSAAEVAEMRRIWQAVAEDYAPFNVDVTTEDPGTAAGLFVTQIVIGGNGSWYGPAGGVAILYSFGPASNAGIGYAFQIPISGGDAALALAEVVSHEAGHTFGLKHQSLWSNGVKLEEYHPGTGDWAPIMGVSYGNRVATWALGPNSSGPDDIQDDIARLADYVAFWVGGNGFRPDDRGDNIANASPISAGSPGAATGLINSSTDVDVFSFTVSAAGPVTARVTGDAVAANLDAVLELRNAAGQVLKADNPTDSADAMVAANLAPGTYYLFVKSTGVYGRIGQYTVTAAAGTPPKASLVTPPVVTAPLNAITFAYDRPMQAASFDRTADIASFTGPGGSDLLADITGAVWLDDRTVTVNFFERFTPGAYTLVIGSNVVAANGQAVDQNGNGAPGEPVADRFSATVAIGPNPDAAEANDTRGAATNLGTVTGTVTRTGMNIHLPSDQDYYRVTTAGYGTLSATATPDPGAGVVDVAVVDSNGTVLASKAGTGNAAVTVTAAVTAGQVVFVRVTGSAGTVVDGYALEVSGPPSVAFNLSGGAVPEFRAVGTSAGTLAAASSVPRTYTYALVAGTGSTDNAKFKVEGNKLVSNAVFDAMVKASYSVRVRATDQDGGSIDKAFTITVTDSPAIAIGGRALYVNGTAGNDSFGFAAGTVNHGVSLNGTNWTIPKSLVDVAVFFGNGGQDSADLTAVGSKNAAGLAPTFGVLAGSGYEVWATGTSKLTARGGAADVAYLAGTDGDDFLMATPTNTVLTGTGYSSTAAGFGTTVGYAGNGKDSALLMGSDGDDVFVGTPTYGALTGAGFANYAAGFDSVSASAGKGNDGAFLADSAGVDTVGGSGAMVTLTGPGFAISVDGFDGTVVYGFAGGKNKKLTAGVTAYLETPGDWTG